MSCGYLSLASVLIIALAALIFLPANVSKTRHLHWLPYLLSIFVGLIFEHKHCIFQDPWLAILLLVFALELISTTKRQPYFFYFLTAWAIAAASFLVFSLHPHPTTWDALWWFYVFLLVVSLQIYRRVKVRHQES